MARGVKGEPEVVIGKELAAVLQDWKYIWLLERQAEWRKGHETHVEGPLTWLSMRTGINPRRLRGLINAEFQHVGLKQADLVLQTIERQGYLGDVIRVIPNPKWGIIDWVNYMGSRGCDPDEI